MSRDQGGCPSIADDKGKGETNSFPFLTYSAPGGLRQDPGRDAELPAEARTCGNGGHDVRVLLSTYGGRGDVEPLVGLAVRLRALGAEVRVCAPPDWADRLAQFGVPLVPIGPPVRALMHGATPPSVADVPRRAAELIAEQFDKLPAAAEGCDAMVATGLFPVAASVQSVAEKLSVASLASFEKLGIRYVFAAYCPIFLPSPHRPPHPLPGRPLPAPPVYVGFGSMRAPTDIARVAIDAIQAQGRRALVARGWANLAPIDDRDDCFAVGEVNQQALFRRVAAVVHHGGAGTTTTAARAGAPQVVVPQMADQPYWAGRVVDLGIGTAHDGPTPTTESLSAALKRTLTAEIGTRATAVAGAIRTNGATVAATLLRDAVNRDGPPGSA